MGSLVRSPIGFVPVLFSGLTGEVAFRLAAPKALAETVDDEGPWRAGVGERLCGWGDVGRGWLLALPGATGGLQAAMVASGGGGGSGGESRLGGAIGGSAELGSGRSCCGFSVDMAMGGHAPEDAELTRPMRHGVVTQSCSRSTGV